MTSGPMGPATDLLGEVRFQLLLLNEQIRDLVDLERRELPVPQVTVAPTPVVVGPSQPVQLDLAPLLVALEALDARAEQEALRKEFSDLSVSMRHIAGSQSVGSGSSYVTTEPAAGKTWPVVDAPLEIRYEYQDPGDASNRPLYIGQAVPGTGPAEAVWRVDKFTFSPGVIAGTYVLTRTQTLSQVAWDNRASLPW